MTIGAFLQTNVEEVDLYQSIFGMKKKQLYLISLIRWPPSMHTPLEGRYRDKSMLFFIVEYRHMFRKRSGTMSKHGFVAWLGTGSVASSPSRIGTSLPNGGAGYRFEVQPRMNLRIDIGIGRETRGFYFNFNEAF